MTHEGENNDGKLMMGCTCISICVHHSAKQQVEALTMIIDAKLHSARKQATGKSRFTGEKMECICWKETT